MSLTEIATGLPVDLSQQLMSNERVYYFTFISFKGGCGSSTPKQDYWLALTDKRVMYKTKVLEVNSKANISVERNGDLPFDKISFIEVVEGQSSQGCSSQKNKAFELRISTSGGTIAIPIPTKEKGYEVRKVYTELGENR